MERDLIHFGYRNKNNRIYKEDYINLNELNNRAIFGEFGFPNSFDVSLSNVSHKISNFEIINGVLYGDIEILNTPKGKELKEIMKINSVVFRPRGSGSVNSDGTIDNYKLFAFDVIFANEDPFDITKLRLTKLNKILSKIKR